MNQAQLSAITSVSNLPAFFFAIWLGNLIDRKGIRKVPIILFALATIVGVLRIFSPNYITLFLLTFLASSFFLPVNIIAPKLFAPYFSAGEMERRSAFTAQERVLALHWLSLWDRCFPLLRLL